MQAKELKNAKQAGRSKSEGKGKLVSEAPESTINFDAQEEIRQFGQLMAPQIDQEELGIPMGPPDFPVVEMTSEQMRLGAAVKRAAR